MVNSTQSIYLEEPVSNKRYKLGVNAYTLYDFFIVVLFLTSLAALNPV